MKSNWKKLRRLCRRRMQKPPRLSWILHQNVPNPALSKDPSNLQIESLALKCSNQHSKTMKLSRMCQTNQVICRDSRQHRRLSCSQPKMWLKCKRRQKLYRLSLKVSYQPWIIKISREQQHLSSKNNNHLSRLLNNKNRRSMTQYPRYDNSSNPQKI